MPTTPAQSQYAQLLTVIRTKKECDATMQQCEGFLNLIYGKHAGNLKTLLEYAFSEDLAMLLYRTLQEDHIDEKYKMKLQTFITDFSAFLADLPVVNLTVAFLPTKNSLILFSDWLRKNLDPQALIACSTDETLIAGAVIEYNGVYKAFSAREVIPEAIERNRHELLQLLA